MKGFRVALFTSLLLVTLGFLDAQTVEYRTLRFASDAQTATNFHGATAISLAMDDFNEDGIPDLLRGFDTGGFGTILLNHGTIALRYPNSPEAKRLRNKNPFEKTTHTFVTQGRPDFLQTGDFNGDGHRDIALATKNSSQLEFHWGNGRGGFHDQKLVKLPGVVTAMRSGEIGMSDGIEDLALGLIASGSAQLLILNRPAEASEANMVTQAMPANVTAIAIGLFDDDFPIDVLAVAQNQALLLPGSKHLDFAVLKVAPRQIELAFQSELITNGSSQQLVRNTSSGTEFVDVASAIRGTPYSTQLPAGATFAIPALLNADGVNDYIAVYPDSPDPVLFLSQPNVIFTVNSTVDPGNGVCDVAECTLREAITTANGNGVFDSINFNITGGGVHTITPATPLPAITQAVAIDATTQPGFAGTPLIELNGTNAGAGAHGITINSDFCTVRGFAINRFTDSGIRINQSTTNSEQNHVEGNFLGVDPTGTTALPNGAGITVFASDNTIGGTVSAARNIVSSNTIVNLGTFTFQGNKIQGNFVGTNLTGTVSIPSVAGGIGINGGSSNIIGGTTAGAGNLVSGGGDQGVDMRNGAAGTVVQGNIIGLDVTGTVDLGNTNDGVAVLSNNQLIGGLTPAARNIISGNNRHGIHIQWDYSFIRGNYIGTDITGTVAIGNSSDGIRSFFGFDDVIGGSESGAKNVISGNNVGIEFNNTLRNYVEGNFIGTDPSGLIDLGNIAVGIVITGTANDNRIGGSSQTGNLIANNGIGIAATSGVNNLIAFNRIFSNDALGIDLLANGVTANDAQDVDTGTNGLQNYPVLTSVQTSDSGTVISGTLNSSPFFTYTIEFFSNLSCDPSGFGEGATPIDTIQVTADVNGDASFTTQIPTEVQAGQFITAISTDSGDNSSEFSQCRVACADITVSPTTASDGTVGVAYDQSFTSSGGVGAMTFSSTGSLPPGLTLDPSGELSGDPTLAGEYTFTIIATDQNGCTGSREYTVTIASACLFCDDFEDGVLDPNWTILKASWSESGGNLQGVSARKAATVATPVFAGCSVCTIDADMQTAGGVGNRVWLLGWYQNNDNYVEIMMKEEADRWIIRQHSGGVVTGKNKGVRTIDPNVSYHVQVQFDGTQFSVIVDGQALMTLPAAGSPSGTVGFQAKGTTGTFDSISVQ